jgi:gluconate 2-dehydrogenase gamma chain
MERRTALKSFAGLAALGVGSAAAGKVIDRTIRHETDLRDDALPTVRKGGLAFFTEAEAAVVGAIFDRLIPADELSIGAVEAGCVKFTDGQLAGDFGKAASMFRLGPWKQGTPEQGVQDRTTPAERYRKGVAALEKHCSATAKKSFTKLAAADQDAMLHALEGGQLKLEGVDGLAFFNLLLQNVREGFLADPIYGGNKDMAGWKMIGFPGARYDFRDVIDKRGQDLKIIPTSLIER